MATPKKDSKAGYVVISGCIQEGPKLFLLGQPYTPPTEELETELVGCCVIAKADTPAGLAAMAKAAPSDAAEPEAEEDQGA